MSDIHIIYTVSQKKRGFELFVITSSTVKTDFENYLTIENSNNYL